MSARPRLKTTNAQFHVLWEAVHSVRKKSTTIKVDLAALTAVLLDHSVIRNTFASAIDVDDI